MDYTQWPRYKSHKIVQALPIVSITIDGVIVLWVEAVPGNPNGLVRFEPTEMVMKGKAQVGDLALVYPDGYRSICPKRQFDDGYTKLDS